MAPNNKQKGKPGRKRSYEPSTPVIRLRRNIAKIVMHAGLVRDRLEMWASSGDADVHSALESVTGVESQASLLDEFAKHLQDRHFSPPPPKADVWQPEIGQHARVAPEYREKYEMVYAEVLKEDPEMLDDLAIVNVLPTGEVVVRRGKRTPLVARKSHLQKIANHAQV